MASFTKIATIAICAYLFIFCAYIHSLIFQSVRETLCMDSSNWRASVTQTAPASKTSYVTRNYDSAKILVAYSGPLSKNISQAEQHQKNLDFFLKHGIQCATQDTVIIVGKDFYGEYIDLISHLNEKCRPYGNQVLLVTRREICEDMEPVRLVMDGGIAGINIKSYDYFIYVNSDIIGPTPPVSDEAEPWTSRILSLLDDKVKMTGLTMNCATGEKPFIENTMFALDKIGLDIIIKSGAVFDCSLRPDVEDSMSFYKTEMGKSILTAGYALRPLIGEDRIVHEETEELCKPCLEIKEDGTEEICQYKELYMGHWLSEPKLELIFGKELENFVFYNSSIYIPPSVAEYLNRTEDESYISKS